MRSIASASTDDLEPGYEVFRQEALNLTPDYRPETVNTDGWKRRRLGSGFFQE